MVLAALFAILFQMPGGPPRLTFEVASVKPAAAGGRGPTMRLAPGGRFSAEDISLRNLITLAYHIGDDELAGAPGWIESARYDIEAKPAVPGGKEGMEQAMLRLQALLADRFAFRFHQTTSQRAVLGLIVARQGARLEPATGAGPACPGQITSMEMFARTLAGLLDEPVVDETGLPGFFCVPLRLTRDDGPPSIYAALQSQLGLKLEGRKRAVPILVVDHIAQPRPN